MRARHLAAGAFALAVVVLVPARGRADGPPSSAPVPPAAAVTFDGFVSTTYGYNFNAPDSRTNQLRVFDFDDNTFKLDLFELVAQRAVAKARDAGFRVDLAMGSSVPRVSSSAGLFRTDSTSEDIDVHQAFASWIAPVGSGLRLDAGKFITAMGYEVIEGYDAWNDDATRSFLFGFAIPFTHTGLHASYTFSPKVSGALMLVNGWDDARDDNRSKSVGGTLMLAPMTAVSVVLNAMFGPERAGDESDPRTMLDAVATWKPCARVTLGANGDWGSDRNAAGAGRDGRWNGVAGYLRLDPGAWALSARGETFDDPQGVRTGLAQRLGELTLTPEAKLADGLRVRADLRVDHSDHAVFEKGRGLSRSQPTVLVELLYTF